MAKKEVLGTIRNFPIRLLNSERLPYEISLKEGPSGSNLFQRDRSRHQSYQSESDMIEHTDALGRTSYISKKELSLVREKDREMADLTRDDYDERYSRYSDGSRSPSPENKQARLVYKIPLAGYQIDAGPPIE